MQMDKNFQMNSNDNYVLLYIYLEIVFPNLFGNFKLQSFAKLR